MKKLLCALLTLCLLLCGCNTGKTIDDPNILTGIYAPVLTGLGTADTIAASSLVPWQDGYAYAVQESNAFHRTADEEYRETLSICHVAEDGAVTTMPVALDRLGQSYMAGARGVYTFVLGEVKNHYDLVQIDWDGNVVARVDVTEQKPTGATTTTPKAATIYTDLPMAETKDGLVIAWGKALLCYDHTLTYTGTIDLPGTADTVFAEDDVLWVSYTEKDTRILGKVQDGAVAESYPMPESFAGVNSYYWTRLIGCRDGWLYGWDTTNVVRWQYGAETETVEVAVVFDFLHSGISGQKVTLVHMVDDKYFSIQTTTDNGTHQALHLYEKAPDKDLSQMTVLTVAAVQLPEELEAAILDFHATHDDYYIRTISYAQYNTADEPDKGYQLFMTDLTTGILQADILYGSTYDAIDLYPLMTGEVQKEDIAPAVRRSLEVDGKLTSIGPTFRVSTLVGKTDTVPERFTLAEFLDYAEGLSADEHLMEEMGWQNADSMLFGNTGYASFLQNGKATFDDPLFTRLLTFLSTLSESGEKYMDEGVDNSAMVLAGEISEAQLQVEAGGENLYWNGKIQFTQDPFLNTPNQLLKQYARFGTTDITLPGYPTVAEENGVRVSCGGTYAITGTCQSPAVAWECIETILQNAAALSVTDLQGNVNLRESFTTLTKPYMDYLESLRGLRMVVTEGNKFYAGMDVALDEKGQYMGKPGMVLEVGDALIEDIRWLYEEAGGLRGYSGDIYQIVWEEVSRYLAGGCDAGTCAQAVQSRAGLYMAENS